MTKRETIAEMLERGAELQTARGDDVRIFMTDAGGGFPVLGAYYHPEPARYPDRVRWVLSCWDKFGERNVDALNLIEKPQTRVYERWVNVYEGGEEFAYCTREKADTAACAGKRIACIHIRQEYTVGEGLEDETAHQAEREQ